MLDLLISYLNFFIIGIKYIVKLIAFQPPNPKGYRVNNEIKIEDKLKELTSEGIDAKSAEKIICNTIYKMELLKDDHEKSIYLSQKIKELIKKNEEMKKNLEDNIKILDDVQENIQLNVDTMNKNIKVIKQKLNK